jgi:hypothetical protein
MLLLEVVSVPEQPVSNEAASSDINMSFMQQKLILKKNETIANDNLSDQIIYLSDRS